VVTTTGGAGRPYCFDTTCLAHFARAERLDVLRELLVEHECWTTTVVLAEIRRGTESYPLLAGAANLEWVRVASLDALDELSCFVKWANRIGSQERNLGEASVLAAAELRNGIAITDDRDATVVARQHGAEAHGTIWLLAQACRHEKLTHNAAGNVVDALRTTGARLPCTGNEFPAFAAEHGLLDPD
jgi:predicted nucleic acid-binding protein